MTDHVAAKLEAEIERFRALRDPLLQMTVAENLARLDALPPSPKHIMDEIKVIESLLLALLLR